MRPLDRLDPFDRRLYAGLADLAQPRVPAYLDEVLALTVRTRQRRGFLLRGRSVTVSRLAAIAAAAILLVALVAFVLLGAGRTSRITPEPSPVPVATSSAASSTIPAPLAGRWVRWDPNVTTRGLSGALGAIEFSQGRLAFVAGGTAAPLGTISSSDAGVITLAGNATNCPDAPTASYHWVVSQGGGLLSLSGRNDACRNRGLALSGGWQRTECRDPVGWCAGELAAGTWNSVLFTLPADGNTPQVQPLTFTVPGGWADSIDRPDEYLLERAASYASDARSAWSPAASTLGIHWYGRPAAYSKKSDCSSGLADGAFAANQASDLAAALVSWAASLDGLRATPPKMVNGLGQYAWMTDISLDPASAALCHSAAGVPFRPLFMTAAEPTAGDVMLTGAERIRVIAEQPTVSFPDEILLIVVDDPTGQRFDALLSDAMPIVLSSGPAHTQIP